MKIKKIAVSLITVFAAVIMPGFSVSAEYEITDDEEIQIEEAINDNNEAVSGDSGSAFFVNGEKSTGNNSVFDLTISGYDMDKAYKMYILDNLMITSYKDNPDFKSLITDSDRIMLPADGKLVTFMKEDSEYKSIGEKHTDDTPDFNTLTRNILNSIDEEIIDVKHTYSFMYYMDIIYIETAENEYAVPYLNGYGVEEEIGDRLISGTIYTVPEFMDRMDQTYDEEYAINHGDEIGGVPYKEYKPYVQSLNTFSAGSSASDNKSLTDSSSNIFAVIAVITAAAVSVTVLTVFIIFNFKKKKPEN
ncbi:MAG: hypothetical protein NC320_00305 [Clostridium sp.]|nr:hypothetical protein [Clostridium sp.]MCM1546773.1 hypothetical protein [Ruminococcus sp.]